MAFWFDGAELWLTTAASAEKVRVLRRDPSCVAWVPPADDGPGAVVRGEARVFSIRDPVGLALHGPVIGAAMTAMAARNVDTILGYAQDVRHIPPRWAPQNRVVLRVRVEEVVGVLRPEPPAGATPPLPTVVPTEVRRALAGESKLAVVTDDGHLTITPAVWQQGFRLTAPADRPLPTGPAAVVVDSDPRARPTGVVGLVLCGRLDTAGVLHPTRATWWRGFELATVDVPDDPAPGVTLPD